MIDTASALRVIVRAFPGRAVAQCEPAAGGVLNAVFRVRCEGMQDEFALRFFTRDPACCRKEMDLYAHVGARVPVPEILFADPDGEIAPAPCFLMRWVPGETWRTIKERRQPAEMAQCARSLGDVLARIGSFRFASGGMLASGLVIGPGPVSGPDPVPRMIEQFLAVPHAARRTGARLAARVCAFAWERAPQLAAFDAECCLVHSDFGSPNVVLHRPRGPWEVAAVLDWEFAFSGTPLYDVGHLLRYETPGSPSLEPHFSAAYRAAGGVLPGNWQHLARTLDLTALCEMLGRPSLPDGSAAEILTIIRRIVDSC